MSSNNTVYPSLNANALRPDLATISNWIPEASRLLDLGCGDGTFLQHMQQHRGATGYGVEIDPSLIPICIERGVNVLQLDIDTGLNQFEANSFDVITLTLSLQQLQQPERVLNEILRIGREGIVTFPNFGHWKSRLSLLLGRMPRTRALPSTWFNTKNIHLCTLSDFELLCADNEIEILDRAVINGNKNTPPLWPNLMGEVAVYRFTRKSY